MRGNEVFTDEEYQEIKGKEVYIEDTFRSFKPKAEETLKNSDETKCVITKAMKKLNKYERGPIHKLINEMKLLFNMVIDYVNKKYNKVEYMSIVAIVAGIIYFISPIDFMPDFIPYLGCIDDAFVITLVLKQIEKEFSLYKEYIKSAS